MAARRPTPKRKPARKRVNSGAGRYALRPIGVLRSSIKTRADAPRQGHEGGVDAWLEVRRPMVEGLEGIKKGDEIIVVTWLHRGQRDTLKVQRRRYNDPRIWGVFTTRSPDRPNPLGLHPVTVRKVSGNRLLVGPIEAIDRTPVVDIKPVLTPPPKQKR
ncbi:MAG TPA: tRNA (N6-threonylcarbamoyladenosine(37)-N6)-methyltransferase TrmO [bacterium]